MKQQKNASASVRRNSVAATAAAVLGLAAVATFGATPAHAQQVGMRPGAISMPGVGRLTPGPAVSGRATIGARPGTVDVRPRNYGPRVTNNYYYGGYGYPTTVYYPYSTYNGYPAYPSYYSGYTYPYGYAYSYGY